MFGGDQCAAGHGVDMDAAKHLSVWRYDVEFGNCSKRAIFISGVWQHSFQLLDCISPAVYIVLLDVYCNCGVDWSLSVRLRYTIEHLSNFNDSHASIRRRIGQLSVLHGLFRATAAHARRCIPQFNTDAERAAAS